MDGIAKVTAVDASGILRAVNAARRFNHRTPAVAVNTAAYVIAGVALRETPTATVANIDRSMGATSVPVLSTRGKRKGLPLKSGKLSVTVAQPSAAIGIVLQRLNPNSRYNRMTGGRWALDRSRFSPGAGREGFARHVQLTAVRMVKGRHSSISFLKSGWILPIRQLLASGLVSRSASRGAGIQPPRQSAEIADSGWSVPAQEGTIAVVEVANAIGTKGGNAVMNQRHNDALHQFAGPALERAIAFEFVRTCEYVAREEAKRHFWNMSGVVIDI